MRTTLEIDDTVLAAARSLARSRGCSLGEAVSELAKRGLQAVEPGPAVPHDFSYSPFPVIIGEPHEIVTHELIASLRDA